MADGAPRATRARPATWFVTRKYPPRFGGMEQLSWELTTRLGRRRPSRVLALRRGTPWLPLFLVSSALRLAAAARRGEVALVHLGDPVLAPLGRAVRRFGVPVCVTVHGLDVSFPHPLYRRWLRGAFDRLDAYVCISNAARDAAVAAGAPSAKTSVIGVGLTPPGPAHVPVAREADRLLFVGRLVRRKGLGWFVRAVLPKLVEQRRSVRLAVIGAGQERQAIELAASAAGVADRIDWLGPLADDDKWSWYRRAAVCVMPNVSVPGDLEGFGIAALEAGAAACPLVASDLEGLRDAIEHREGGLLVRAEDAEAWVRAIMGLLDDPTAARALGERAAAWVRAHRGWDAVCDGYEALFDTLVAGARR
jgi:phosphatidyl-myo-inositol dimannoside synthase